MISRRIFLLASLLFAFNASAQQNPVVVLDTTMGEIQITLYPDKAPVTVKNFMNYVNAGHYNGTIFHRVIKGFMIQGGGLDETLKKIGSGKPITNEADNGLQNLTGTIAMARTASPNSATDQFFINVSDNTNLDYTAPTPRGWGYAVFGMVSYGMDVVHKIENVATASRGDRDDVPVKPVKIISATLLK
jgi:cyclophilin family peptidyl-prolyl cis-trans isomerase